MKKKANQKKQTEQDYAVAIIVCKAGEVLLQKKSENYRRAPGKWCLFGGEVKRKNTPEETVEIELGEEIGGYVFGEGKHFTKVPYSDPRETSRRTPQQKGIQFVFEYKIDMSPFDFIKKLAKEKRPLALKEGVGFAFFSKKELNEYQTHIVDGDLKLLRIYLQSRE